MLPLHHLLHRQGSDDIKRHAGIVAFAVAWRDLDDRIVISDTGFL
jgi:hypothetical protein